ncbi:MAG: ornithine cyclodeaminase family protein [Bacillota bacterium]|uniref:Ornithine cyclodeaminase family protein n=1 Tax=Virgibacillus salarius TaxID=447199 RepID=A0A941IAD7_9BACI|nr:MULTISPECIES: ornithine cyclodeaminase family protein [Bacillaceae]NAZ09287.1 ornithine cyclodeaminase family protein [Agaribacter marinus]MBR7796578.1 ornithine cyclodeaminase family protein [Virgibacillus salarius]MCC2250903.1 ornithine cyclodeaminase family protein [Virgibacillus sp. AGTR]MDY7042587.1 ornithine cyclodeaminase family protein [Virgibacillus sp. M23]QRZ17056.1 ornithine cyclodeaminase family protein [Virgibacillus sp. AGTR]
MLFLNESAIKEAVSMKQVIHAIDNAYKLYGSGAFHMPTRMQLQDETNTLLLMPCLTNESIGTKLITSFPNNTSHPTLQGLVILTSRETGECQALLDGSFITGIRTGAIGGSAIRHLANVDDNKLAIIGTGVQGLYQAIAACTERPIKDIYLYNRTTDKLPAFSEKLKAWIPANIHIHMTSTIEEAITFAHIIICSTTSNSPVLPNDPDLLTNKLIIGIGSFQPTMREFPEVLYQLADRLYIDTEDAIIESGDVQYPLEKGYLPKDSIISMSKLVMSNEEVSRSPDKSILFKSTGMALFDVVVSQLVYRQALKKGVGQQLT